MWFVFSTSILTLISVFIMHGRIIPSYFQSNSPQIFRSWGLNYDWEKMVEYTPPCVSFSVSHGATCNDMCKFCQQTLGQNWFYFTDNVCLRNGNGMMCHGHPIPSTNYTCCIY
jgi:hypothetical protein